MAIDQLCRMHHDFFLFFIINRALIVFAHTKEHAMCSQLAFITELARGFVVHIFLCEENHYQSNRSRLLIQSCPYNIQWIRKWNCSDSLWCNNRLLYNRVAEREKVLSVQRIVLTDILLPTLSFLPSLSFCQWTKCFAIVRHHKMGMRV